MRTEPRTLHRQTFDLLLVGGGIHGLAIARDAALRGLQVALVEARDFAAGTSSRSSRLIHGGLRYLQHGHLALVREALHERERLLRLAPHLVRPLPMLMPFFKDGGGSPWLHGFGTWLYSRLATNSTLPRPQRLSATAAAAAFPGLRTNGLRSGLLFFDAATQDARLCLANAQAAAAAGARLCNHTELVGRSGDWLLLRDRLAGAEILVRATHVVNAAGPHADAVRRRLDCPGPDLVRTTRGSHLVLAPRDGELALAAFLPDQRIQFVIPHPGGTLCGTTDVDDPLAGDETGPPPADVDYLLQALGFLLDPAPTRAAIRFGYAGWRSLPARQGPPGALNREAFVVDEPLPSGRLFTIVGGKLTTHRALAERVVAQLFAFTPPSATRKQPLPGGDGPREVLDPLWWRHGSVALRLRAQGAMDPALLEPLCPHRPFLVVELVHALRELGAVTFVDLMLRRLIHVLGPCQQDACLQRAHQLFVRYRLAAIDGDSAAACAALRAEVRELSSGLATEPG